MRRAFHLLLLAIIAVGAGWGTSELLGRWSVTAPFLARLFGHEPVPQVVENLAQAATAEQISDVEIEQELDLLRRQFADEATFLKALQSSGSSLVALRAVLTAHLRARRWIEETIAPEINVTEAECRALYNSASDHFVQPQRFRANHLFLAAPAGTSPEVFAGKRTAIQGLAIRSLAGESFSALVAEASEDEATKERGGDLGYFSAHRMPREFVGEIEKLRTGEVSAPVQSHLGFHLLKLTELKPPKQLAFEEVQAEIVNTLANNKRVIAVTRLATRLSTAEFRETAP